ncbi:SWM histone demethylase complex subunit phf1 [Cyphellophora attinorum]|uniref:SWM histone demethylase complex subunit phf1 n=1 Tax=Cyphellophora attinorum TaxID=1664694 RepID=A0A0N1GYU3_9EURO|nr:SWM histone demethylase complex subunit phf1 [Phialophora attinorum]KPI35970.1 SWM histone demethylase complex subunit phf1 [Phialophora attinorum]
MSDNDFGSGSAPTFPETESADVLARDREQSHCSDVLQVNVDQSSDSQLSSSIGNLDELKSEIFQAKTTATSGRLPEEFDLSAVRNPDSTSPSLASSNLARSTAAADAADSREGNSHIASSSLAVDSPVDEANGSVPHSYFSTIKMAVPGRKPRGQGGRRAKNYQLDDGTIVSGKGLGRGRPGVKRGPRRSSLADELASGASTPGSAPKIAANAKADQESSIKRRRSTKAQRTKDTADSDSELSASRESTPEYNPTEETRSGRKIQKPAAPQPVVPESASPASKRPKLESRNTGSASSPALKLHPKIKRRLYRGREQLALCEHCQRGHGPQGNAIVFCDACNKCWHQRCHDPHVPQSIVSDSKAEWFCSNCEKILHGKKGKKVKAGETPAARAVPPMPQFVGPLVGGAALTQAHKIAFLESRTKEQLISLILQGSDLAPALPMFQTPAPQLPQAQFKSNYVTPISSTPGLHTAGTGEVEDEGYDSYFDDHAALYPKPGQGVKLPPDSVDLHMLLEHPQSRTFSHWIRGMPTREYSGNADIVFQRQQ